MVTSVCLALASGPPNGSYTLTFQALPDQATYPDGATVTNITAYTLQVRNNPSASWDS
jgi:hypothetical protein